MKLTKTKLKQIIKEELQLVMGGIDHEENFIKALQEDSLGTGIADAAAKEQEAATQAKLQLVIELKNEMRKLTENSSFVWRFSSNDAHTRQAQNFFQNSRFKNA